MIRKSLIRFFAAPASIFVAPSNHTFAADAVLRLNVEGFIAPAPSWRNAADEVIQSMKFEFRLISDASNPFINRDSQKMLAKLVNAQTDPAEISLIRPKGCAIGSGSIKDRDVALMQNGIAHSADGNFQMNGRQLQEFMIRFRREGGYGSLSGKVACDVSGELIYKY